MCARYVPLFFWLSLSPIIKTTSEIKWRQKGEEIKESEEKRGLEGLEKFFVLVCNRVGWK
jgi:hypothetical protein